MAIHRLVLTDGMNPIESGLTNNYLFDCLYCAYPVLTFTNQHNSTLTLTNIIYAPASIGQSLTTIFINGSPASFPYTILQGESIDILVEICGAPATWGMTLVTDEHTNDLQYQFPMTGIDGSALWDSLDIDFGSVPVGTSATVTRTITNIACDTQYVSFTTIFCGVGVGLVQITGTPGIPIPIPPGASVPITLQWTPNSIGQVLSCNIWENDSGCASFTVSGLAIEAPAEHHFELVAGLNTEGQFNKMLCCGQCAYSLNTFENKVNAPLDVTDIVLNTTGSGVTVNIIGINGTTPSFPFTVAAFDEFSVEFEICWDTVTSPLGTWSLTIETTQYGLDLQYDILMSCIDTTYFYGDSESRIFGFGDVIVGLPSTQPITGANPAFFSQTLALTLSGCTGVTVSENPVLITQEQYPSFDVTWTPSTVGETLSCTIEDECGISWTITGNAIEAPCEDCFCLLDLTIETEKDYLLPVSGLENGDVLYSTASFLERKTAVFSFIYPAGINSQWQFQFTPALFLSQCHNPFEGDTISLPVHYSITYIQSLMPDGIPNGMSLIGTGSNELNIKNWECTFTPISASTGTFKIKFSYYHIKDNEVWLDSTLNDNLLKFKRATLSCPTDWTNTFTSVYSKQLILGSAFMIIDPNILDGQSFTYCQKINCAPYIARFYNKGLYNQPSEFLNPTWTLSRTTGTVSNFSILEKTKIEFKITIPAPFGSGEPVCIYHVFDVTNVDNSVDFFASSDSSRYRVQPYTGTAVLNNHLVRPAGVSNVSGEWVFYMYVGQTINPTAKYRVAAIVYDSDKTMVNTFLSEEISVTRYPDMNCECQPDIQSTFLQYWQETGSDCFRPVAKERIGHRLILKDGGFTSCLNSIGLDDFNWREQLQSVQLNIYKKIEGYPSASKTAFYQYQTHKSIRNSAFFGGFQNLNNMLVADVGATDVVIGINDIRVPWEDVPFSGGQVLTADTATYLNRTNAGSMTSAYISSNSVVQSWIDETVYFEYVFTFQLRDQIGEPFFWNVVKAFPVSAIELEPDNSGSGNIITDVTIEGLDPVTGLYVEIEPPICFKDWNAIKLTYQANREGNFIFFMEKEPFGFSTIVENNELNSHFGMTQINNPLVLSMDTFYDPSTFQASVVLDAPNFDDSKYRFCGYISEPQAAEACAYFMKFTKLGGIGVTFTPSPQIGGTATVGFSALSFGYLYLAASLGDTLYPSHGNTYVFEWNYASPTTLITQVFFGRGNFDGAPDLIIPVGSTSGSHSFVWNNIEGAGWFSMKWQTGTPMTNTGVFKLGNELCP